jgi:hypothetical protein
MSTFLPQNLFYRVKIIKIKIIERVILKMGLNELGWEDVKKIHLAQHSVQ